MYSWHICTAFVCVCVFLCVHVCVYLCVYVCLFLIIFIVSIVVLLCTTSIVLSCCRSERHVQNVCPVDIVPNTTIISPLRCSLKTTVLGNSLMITNLRANKSINILQTTKLIIHQLKFFKQHNTILQQDRRELAIRQFSEWSKNFTLYSQTCLKWPFNGHIRQVVT